MLATLQALLQGIEKEAEIIRYRPVSGGCINRSFYVQTRTRAYFVKVNEQMDHRFFQAEAHGLKLLKKTNTIAVPDVIGISREETDNRRFSCWNGLTGRRASGPRRSSGGGWPGCTATGERISDWKWTIILACCRKKTAGQMIGPLFTVTVASEFN